MHCWRAGATPQSALGYIFSFAEGVPALPAMVGLHATLYPELDVRTGAFPSLRRSLRQGAVYGEFSFASRRSRSSKLSRSYVALSYLVQYYARAFGELEIRYVWQRLYKNRASCTTSSRSRVRVLDDGGTAQLARPRAS